jgi:hypothetical protein
MYGQCVVAVYDSLSAAEGALMVLKHSGVPSEQVSLMAKQVKGSVPEEQALEMGDRAEKDATTGAGVGALVGLLAGAPLLAIPGVGPILAAGPIATALTGGIVGGFLGSMQGWGVQSDRAESYEDKVRAGKVLVIVHGEPRDVAQAVRLLQTTPATSVEMHAESPSDQADP